MTEDEKQKIRRLTIPNILFAECMGLDPKRLQQLRKEGRIPQLKKGNMLEVWPTISGYVSGLKVGRGIQQSASVEGETLDELKAKEIAENVRRKARENLQAEGELLEAEAVRLEWSQQLQSIANMLETLTDTIEREAGITPQQAASIQAACDRARNALYQQMIGDA